MENLTVALLASFLFKEIWEDMVALAAEAAETVATIEVEGNIELLHKEQHQ
jgi:hypothetical protein